MKLNHKTTRFIYLALVSSFLFAGDVSTANKANHNKVGQTYSTYDGTSTTEFDSVIPSSEINEINNLDYSENYNHQDVDRYNSHGNESNNLKTTIISRDDETIYQFTNCGQTGRTGPSQSQTDNAYAGTTLDGLVTINTQGIQEWTIPISGNYSIHAYGGQGGNGGDGASIIGEFNFNAGDVIHIAVGQMGSNKAGGGGTFIYNNTTSTFLLVAGGGGGGASNTENQGQATEDGMDGYESGNYSGVYAGKGGTNGGGGGAGSASDNCTSGGNGGDGADGGNTNGTSSNPGAGGAGIYGNGGSGYNGIVQGGRKWSGFMLGGSGNSNGGFGGGGAAYSGYGGGGGYSGGGGGAWNTGWSNAYGGGAGSLNTGTNQINTTGGNTGHGLVVITSLAPPNAPPTATAQSVTGNEDSPQAITLAGNDPEGEGLTFALATNPSNGTATLEEGAQASLTFDGVDDNVELPMGILSENWEEFSVQFKIIKLSGTSYAGYIGQGQGGGEIGYNFLVWTHGGDENGTYMLFNAAGISPGDYPPHPYPIFDGAYYLPFNEPHYITFTLNNNTKMAKLYVDGVETLSKDYSSDNGFTLSSSRVINIGSYDGNGWFNNVIMDDIKIFDQALASEQILNEINGLENPTSENLCIYIWSEIKTLLPNIFEIEIKETKLTGCVYRGEKE